MSWYKTAASFWGKRGAGVLYYCPEDRSVFLTLRDPDVEQGETWGVPGGSISGEGHFESEDFESVEMDESQIFDYALEEVVEELGHLPPHTKILGKTEFKDSGFIYTTFVVEVPKEEKENIVSNSELDWENTDVGWHWIGGLPDNLHFGVEYVLEQTGNLQRL